jgi:membrane-bound serine protease (ClpP class)
MLPVYITCLLLGIVLLGAEIYVPGGVLGVLGAAFLVAAIIVGYRVEIFQPHGGTISAIIILLTSTAGFLFWLHYFPHSPVGRRLSLQDDGKTFRGDNLHLSSLMDAEGVTITTLRPAGEAKLNGERVDVIADGSFIEQGARVRVVNVNGNRVVVRAIEDGPSGGNA